MSNTERQRQFRERNPGYYGRLHAKRRAAETAALEAKRVALQAQAAVVKREPLLLPAPAVTIEIPGINSIPTNATVAEMVAVRGD
jgi:hypothetical protein